MRALWEGLKLASQHFLDYSWWVEGDSRNVIELLKQMSCFREEVNTRTQEDAFSRYHPVYNKFASHSNTFMSNIFRKIWLLTFPFFPTKTNTSRESWGAIILDTDRILSLPYPYLHSTFGYRYRYDIVECEKIRIRIHQNQILNTDQILVNRMRILIGYKKCIHLRKN